MKRITVLLAEDHTIVREGFRKMLELEDDFEVVGEAENGRQAVAMVKKLRPAVVVMDIAMPLLNGLEATRQILKAVPSTRILILSAHSDDAYIKNATESGAVGFLLKQASARVLSEGIREVNKGHTLFRPVHCEASSRTRAKVVGSSRTAEAAQRPPDFARDGSAPTDCRRQSQQQIAAELGIGMKTVERHREHLMRSSTSTTPPDSPATPSARASLRAASS
jgi:DNA-binding NarL/FixJ family response regulator